ncbi:MAG: hypothetical protein M3N13_01215 [Candidatus Eremiobacteraeota bacterium]|nr:hypothetical protein [Candidatus Eremiobacteraeota bacterium]
MELGFIPIDKPARVVTVSFYPNASESSSAEYTANRRSMEAWGRSGDVADYEVAYADWLRMLPQIPFYRDFNMPIFTALGIDETEFAWLPLVKCPLPARSRVDEQDVWRDSMVLWDQLSMLQPRVILAQGLDAYNIVRDRCEDKFPHRIVLQKIGRYGTTAYHAAEDERVISQLRDALEYAQTL